MTNQSEQSNEPNEPNEPLGTATDRGIPPINGRKPQSTGKRVVWGAALLAMIGAVYLIPGGAPPKKEAEAKGAPVVGSDSDAKYNEPLGKSLSEPVQVASRANLPIFQPPDFPQIMARAPSSERRPDAGEKRPMTPQERRMLGGLEAGKSLHGAASATTQSPNTPDSSNTPVDPRQAMYAQMAQQTAMMQAAAGTGSPAAIEGDAAGKVKEPTNTLAAQLKTTKLTGTKASRLPDRRLMIARGRLFECSLDTAISSAVAGQVRCTVPLDVRGEDGQLVLLDRGTEVVGEYKSNLQQGQTRMGILWTRAKTPSGVVIDLDSPATDPLGRGGVDGQIETFFWKRFGAAIMLSVLDDVLAAALARNNERGSGNIYLGNSQRAARDAAAVALENSINIPPILVKNQGESVAIFLARDLDFRDVYEHRQLGVR